MTQAQLASEAKVSLRTLQGWISKGREPSGSEALAIAAALRTSPAHLVTGVPDWMRGSPILSGIPIPAMSDYAFFTRHENLIQELGALEREWPAEFDEVVTYVKVRLRAKRDQAFARQMAQLRKQQKGAEIGED